VGADHVRFTYNEKCLTASSAYIRHVLENIDSDRPHIVLADEDPADVQKYLEFLQTGYLSTNLFDIGLNSSNRSYIQLAQGYLLGAILEDVKYQNAILEGFRVVSRHYNDYPCVEAMNMIYDGTEAGSSARALLSDMMAYRVQVCPTLRTKLNGLHSDALADVIVTMAAVRPVCRQVRWSVDCKHYYEEE
jgi:hypothetical protein